ncbi:hypothetical protein V5799_026039 [Amblyomma americanum]|uniref:Uncharacterized protein n=1 Tax=Amblyomma americanum TaxID=6943 RepID=A0AAQ4DJP9_AMBAM
MYKDGRNLLLNPAGFKKDLRVFLDAYNTFKTTAFGIAFAFKNVYQPDVLIAQGHYYSGDNTFAECRVLPPTVVTRPQEANNSYQHDLLLDACGEDLHPGKDLFVTKESVASSVV